MKQTDSLPLLGARPGNHVVARTPQGAIQQDEFLADVHALADRMPPGRHVLNFCQDRYRFLVGFGASLLSGRLSLLPSTRTPDMLRRIARDYPQTFCLHDGGGLGELWVDAGDAAASGLGLFDYPRALDRSGDPATNPSIPADRVAAHVFTSGSTGLPRPHAKHWGSLVASARAQAGALGLDGRAWSLVGTVPSQHMYGFESLVLLTLQGGASLWSGHPFFPADVAAAIAAMPRPRMLVTAPTHLRALVGASAGKWTVDRILSATALLPEDLCRAAGAAFGASVSEIYGSTETGQIATRSGLPLRSWHLLPDVRLERRGDGYWAVGGHVLRATPLSDDLRIVDAEHFDLIGRNGDMINIAGKRGSLAFLNHALLGVPGVVDGCMFIPDATASAAGAADAIPDSTRLCAVVAAPRLSAAQIRRALRTQVDPVFLPRPIILVASVPRNATGKIPREALLALLERHQDGLRLRAERR